MNTSNCIFCGKQTKGAQLEVAGSIINLSPAEVCSDPICIRKNDEEYRQNQIREAMPKLIGEVPEAIRETDLTLLPSEKAKQIAESWIPNSKGKSLFVCGGVRSGKTRSAFMATKRIAIAKMTPILWVDSYRLEEAFTGYGAGNADLGKIRSARLVFMDDLGKEKMTEKVASGIFKILDHRTAHGMTTIVTSNFTPTALSDRFNDETLGGAIRGRLIDFFDRYLLEKPKD